MPSSICFKFLTAEVFEIANPLYIYKNWDGYIRAFLHSDPNCGDVSIVEDTVCSCA